MANYDITLKGSKDRGDAVEVVVADAYQQEGPMTTFFRLDDHRMVIDCWSTRVASFRTADIVAVRRSEDAARDDARRYRRPSRLDRHDCTAELAC